MKQPVIGIGRECPLADFHHHHLILLATVVVVVTCAVLATAVTAIFATKASVLQVFSNSDFSCFSDSYKGIVFY